jgi:hypothetical protein
MSEPVLPDATSDDTDVGWGDAPPPSEQDDDERLTAERPPHHDR